MGGTLAGEMVRGPTEWGDVAGRGQAPSILGFVQSWVCVGAFLSRRAVCRHWATC